MKHTTIQGSRRDLPEVQGPGLLHIRIIYGNEIDSSAGTCHLGFPMQSVWLPYVSGTGQYLSLMSSTEDSGTDDEIQSFCQVNYGVTCMVLDFSIFSVLTRSPVPMMNKSDVNGDNTNGAPSLYSTGKPNF